MSGLLRDTGPPDYSGQYNTQLDPAQEYAYQNWLQVQSALNKRDMSRDNFDYDMRGAFASGAGQADNGHWPDTFKKPNHPSFSDQSQYHGADGQTGGTWSQMGGAWYFQPGQANLQFHGADGLQSYFQQSDPNVRVMLPEQQPQTMQGYVRQQIGGTGP